MCNCKHCEHSLFDVLWGEYKCEKRESVLYILLSEEECSDFKKKADSKPRIAKRNDERSEVYDTED